MRLMIASLLIAWAMYGQQQGGTLLPAPASHPASMEIPQPSSLELEAKDARQMIESQRYQQYLWSQYYKLKSDMLDAEKKAKDGDTTVLNLLDSFRQRYHCELCDLGWDMHWSPKEGLKWATPKPADPPKPEPTKSDTKPSKKKD